MTSRILKIIELARENIKANQMLDKEKSVPDLSSGTFYFDNVIKTVIQNSNINLRKYRKYKEKLK